MSTAASIIIVERLRQLLHEGLAPNIARFRILGNRCEFSLVLLDTLLFILAHFNVSISSMRLVDLASKADAVFESDHGEHLGAKSTHAQLSCI